MTVECNAEHVIDLAFHPVGSAPQAIDGGQSRVGRRQQCLDRQSLARLDVEQLVDHSKTLGRVGPFQVVDSGDVDQHVAAVTCLQQAQQRKQVRLSDDDAAIVAKIALDKLGLKLVSQCLNLNHDAAPENRASIPRVEPVH